MTNKLPLVTGHPFFTEILRMPRQGVLAPEGVVRRIVEKSDESRQRFLVLLQAAYVPICRTAPAVLQRIETLADQEIVANIARNLYEIELGLHPLVKGSPEVPHEVLFRDMLQSLTAQTLPTCLEGGTEDVLIERLGIRHAAMPTLLSYARTLEADFAPPLANSWNDLLMQWLTLTGKSGAHIQWRFIDEHRLTEGVGEETGQSDMHVDVIERMCGPYADPLRTYYDANRRQYHRVLCEHLDPFVEAIRALAKLET